MNNPKHYMLVGVAALAGIFILCAGVVCASTCTWTGTWDTPPTNGDVIIIASGGNLTWSSAMPSNVASWSQQLGYAGTVTVQTVYGSSGFTNLTVTGDMALHGGVLTHAANPTAEANCLRVIVNGNLFITNAAISADSFGRIQQQGPGTGAAQTGGAYGGAASGINLSVNPNTYGSVSAPVNLGSGGGNSAGSPGGGAILLTVMGTTTVASAGIITANGGSSGSTGGSGGSIYLTTGWLAGSGTLQAKGGTSVNYNGGGGRVAIILTGAGSDFSSWSGPNIAYGGGSGGTAAAAGTVYRKTQAGVDSLIIDNNNNSSIAGACSTLMPAAPNAVNLNHFANVDIRNKGILGVNGDTTLDFNTFMPTLHGPSLSAIALNNDASVTYPVNMTVNDYVLYVKTITPNKMVNLTIGANGVLSHYMNYGAIYQLNLTIAGNLTVLSNGTINANAFGYFNRQGPGYVANFGGAYGGQTLNGAAVNPNTHGSIMVPVNLGSGGSGSSGGSGGGTILLNVAGTTTVAAAGVITANGGNGGAGGAGGSVSLVTGWLIGGGTVRANGGNSGGSGGRVAIILTGTGADFNSWNGYITAYSDTTKAAAGTVYRQVAANSPGAGTVIVDNGNTSTNLAFTCLPAFNTSSEILSQTVWMVSGKARLGLVTNAVIQKLTLSTITAFLELAGHTGTVSYLAITNHVYSSGIYSAGELGGLVTDNSGGNGRLVVNYIPDGTIYSIR